MMGGKPKRLPAKTWELEPHINSLASINPSERKLQPRTAKSLLAGLQCKIQPHHGLSF